MRKYLYRLLIDLTNNIYISTIIRSFTSSKYSRHLIHSFAKTYKINIKEAQKKLSEYTSLHDFFVRTLKKESRPIEEGLNTVVSPVDGFVEDVGGISKQKEILVKGQVFSIKEMLGNDAAYRKYEDGIYVILYLSPRDYHRIHSPISGEIVSQWDLGGKSYPVNKWGLKYGRSPLSKNYRRISEIKSHTGMHLAVAKVGALFINSVTLTHAGESLDKGEEIGYFSFGSTVVLLFEKGSFQPEPDLRSKFVNMGQKIGILVQL